jgi:hypothetical protein
MRVEVAHMHRLADATTEPSRDHRAWGKLGWICATPDLLERHGVAIEEPTWRIRSNAVPVGLPFLGDLPALTGSGPYPGGGLRGTRESCGVVTRRPRVV